jgi:ferric-dicitrate binding protein FerR (iron transport regulator)
MTDKNNTNIASLITDRRSQDFESQITDAVHAVSVIEDINTKAAYLKVLGKIQKESGFSLFITTLSKVAAILFFPLLIASGILLYRQLNVLENHQFAMQEITSPAGVRSQVVLPDGSNVWLNAESTIRFKVPFDKSIRNVSLSGEAFFEVKNNPMVPFEVKSGDVNVRVLGTKFNYKAFADENYIEVVLAEGRVNFTTARGQTGKEIVMKPGDRVIFDKLSNHTAVTNEKVDKYIAWHCGKLVFDETPMPEVATQIGRWFGVDVVIKDPKIMDYRITTTFENESLHQVLELLRLSSPLEINYIMATINKTNQLQTKSKVIFSKKMK